jgi:UDP-N-acetylglucosamine 2-epimerase (non-hydrolysing)
LLIPVAHVEAGLRSYDRTMPEELNRLVTDQLASVLYTPSMDGTENLHREGIPDKRIEFVGNVMIDTLVRLQPAAEAQWENLSSALSLPERFGLVTLHRPSNVDDPEMLTRILETLNEISGSLKLLFPIHPRTRQRIQALGLERFTTNLLLAEPLGYLDFLALQSHAAIVYTDSGGVQEETTYLGTPCITLRENTERPITITEGTNRLVGRDMALLRAESERLLLSSRGATKHPALWDGKAGERIAESLRARASRAL